MGVQHVLATNVAVFRDMHYRGGIYTVYVYMFRPLVRPSSGRCTTKDTLQKFLNHSTHKLLSFKINGFNILKYTIQTNITRKEKLTKYKITNKTTFVRLYSCNYVTLKMTAIAAETCWWEYCEQRTSQILKCIVLVTYILRIWLMLRRWNILKLAPYICASVQKRL